ncbi:hypothetical protein EAG_10033 [Camponotus floridanus]|uniref:Uncharacterized protein n=1 Tax=Camponotus floridanus TaxID=104421 RepID=E2AV50_CAMFO|nr:hypothetical protein EAG_10033 [Camponotus floridanus]
MAVKYNRTRTNQRDITTAQHFVRHCPDTRRELYYIVMEEQRGNYDRKNYDPEHTPFMDIVRPRFLNTDKLLQVAIRVPTHSVFLHTSCSISLSVENRGVHEIRPTIEGIVRERAGRKLNTILIRTLEILIPTYMHPVEVPNRLDRYSWSQSGQPNAGLFSGTATLLSPSSALTLYSLAVKSVRETYVLFGIKKTILHSAGRLERLFYDANARIFWGSRWFRGRTCVRTIIKLLTSGHRGFSVELWDSKIAYQRNGPAAGGITQFALRDLSLPESERSCKAGRVLQSEYQGSSQFGEVSVYYFRSLILSMVTRNKRIFTQQDPLCDRHYQVLIRKRMPYRDNSRAPFVSGRLSSRRPATPVYRNTVTLVCNASNGASVSDGKATPDVIRIIFTILRNSRSLVMRYSIIKNESTPHYFPTKHIKGSIYSLSQNIYEILNGLYTYTYMGAQVVPSGVRCASSELMLRRFLSDKQGFLKSDDEGGDTRVWSPNKPTFILPTFRGWLWVMAIIPAAIVGATPRMCTVKTTDQQQVCSLHNPVKHGRNDVQERPGRQRAIYLHAANTDSHTHDTRDRRKDGKAENWVASSSDGREKV